MIEFKTGGRMLTRLPPAVHEREPVSADNFGGLVGTGERLDGTPQEFKGRGVERPRGLHFTPENSGTATQNDVPTIGRSGRHLARLLALRRHPCQASIVRKTVALLIAYRFDHAAKLAKPAFFVEKALFFEQCPREIRRLHRSRFLSFHQIF
jgi:hypothetical protein